MIKLMIEELGDYGDYNDDNDDNYEPTMSDKDYNYIKWWLRGNGYELGITDYSYVKDIGDGIEVVVNDLDDHYNIEMGNIDGTLYHKKNIYNRDQFFYILNSIDKIIEEYGVYDDDDEDDSIFDPYTDNYIDEPGDEDFYDSDFGDGDDRYGDVRRSRRL